MFPQSLMMIAIGLIYTIHVIQIPAGMRRIGKNILDI